MIIEIEYGSIPLGLEGKLREKRKDKHKAFRPTHFPAHNLCDMAISESELVRQ